MIVSERAPPRPRRCPGGGRSPGSSASGAAGIGLRELVLAQLELAALAQRGHDLVHLVEGRHRGGARQPNTHSSAPSRSASRGRGGGCLRTSGDAEWALVLAHLAGSRLTNSTKACRYSPSDRIDTHSSGPWWPSPAGPNSTAGTPASRNEIASEAPSRPTEIWSPSGGPARDRLAEGHHEEVVTGHDRGPAVEDLDGRGVGQLVHGGLDLLGLLARQVAHVHVDHAQVGRLVERVAAPDPAG